MKIISGSYYEEQRNLKATEKKTEKNLENQEKIENREKSQKN